MRKKFSTTKTSLESFQISTCEGADPEAEETGKPGLSGRNSLFQRSNHDLYIKLFRFVYISFSFCI
ncbi:hypothetical protein HMPREF1555_01958 [Porphyromonas gingivalis F0570]|uniref:Uncharacterized protein n=1 Tax=Porphyromonas gingivalis F0570 TaxID=1227271 RepID=A0A0E2LNP5_PORGN|nr:hypothetical protein HMPREF1555_01958 [Porphyromonas gingivalis F0570]